MYIACEDLDFVWKDKDVLEVDEMYKTDIPSWAIAQSFGRRVEEVEILLIDRVHKGLLKPRGQKKN